MVRGFLKFFFARIWPLIPGHKKIISLFASKFIAGKTRPEALALAKKLNSEGFYCDINYIGDHTDSLTLVERSALEYAGLIKEINEQEVRAGISFKLSSFGIFNKHFVKSEILNNLLKLVKEADAAGVRPTVDGEELEYRRETDEVVMELRKAAPVGSVIQAYVKETADTLSNLVTTRIRFPRGNFVIRICKGAYSEADRLIHKSTKKVQDQYKYWVGVTASSGFLIQVATHDKKIVDWVISEIREGRINKNGVEFAMLFGVNMPLARELLRQNFRVVIYVPYGENIEGYCIRRVVEKPKYIFLPVSSLFSSARQRTLSKTTPTVIATLSLNPDVPEIYPKDIRASFRECTVESIMRERAGWLFIPFGCSYQVCLSGGESMVAGGSSTIWNGKYEKEVQHFKGYPTQIWALKEKYYAAYFPDGLEVEFALKINMPCWLVIRRDDVFPGGKINRESPRPFQLPDGSRLEEIFQI